MVKSENKDLTIFCADIGSVANGRFGWAQKDYGDNTVEVYKEGLTSEYDLTTEIEKFANSIIRAIEQDRRVAVGFEAPMFVPARNDPKLLTRARSGEGNRSWSAGAGTGALATGIVETYWVFDFIRKRLGSATPLPVLQWSHFHSSQTLFLWEAFVTDKAKGKNHEDDAVIAVECFEKSLPDLEKANAIKESSVISLLGLSLLRAGWTTDISILQSPCLVIKAQPRG